MRRPTDREVYVYALLSPGLPRRFGVLGRRLNCIAIGEVDAIVEHSNGPGGSLAGIELQHRIVSHLAARAAALLPARFGSRVTESALDTLLTERQDEIRSALRRVRNCEQMTVRVFGRDASEQPESFREQPESSRGFRLQAESTPTSGTAYLIRRQQRAHHVAPEVEVIRRELGPLVKDERVAHGERGIRAVVYHLVPRRTVARYQRRASVLPSQLMPHTVTVTGPWPVFAFAPELF